MQVNILSVPRPEFTHTWAEINFGPKLGYRPCIDHPEKCVAARPENESSENKGGGEIANV